MKFVSLGLLLLLAGCVSNGGSVVKQDQERAHNSAKVHTELAGLYFERSQMGTALAEIDLALQSERNYAPAYNVRGLIHMSLREDKEAEEDFLLSLKLDKADSESQNNYGWFLCQRGRENESIAHFLLALKNPLYTTPERAYLNAGLCAKNAGNTRDAEEFLQRALQAQPDLGQASLALAEIKFAAGDYFAAKKYMEKQKDLTAAQLLMGVRIARRINDANAESIYGAQLRQRYPDARETQLLMHGE